MNSLYESTKKCTFLVNSALDIEKENRYDVYKLDQSIGIWIITIIAVVFGLLTMKSGGSVYC